MAMGGRNGDLLWRKGDSGLGEHREADSVAVDGPQRPILATHIGHPVWYRRLQCNNRRSYCAISMLSQYPARRRLRASCCSLSETHPELEVYLRGSYPMLIMLTE